MQTDLISRSALMAQLSRKKSEVASGRYTEGFNDAILRVRSMVHAATAVDAVPVVHAEWISEVVTKCDWKGRPKQYYQPRSCSVCHKPAFQEYKFCPNCGARMDEKSEEER